MRLIDTELGGLHCRVLDGTDAEGGELRGVVVLCHGYGAPGDDLVGLAPEAIRRRPELAKHVRFIFPAAPIALDLAFGGRAWWPIDMERIQLAMMTGTIRDMSQEVPEGSDKARQALLALLDEVQRMTGLGIDRIVLGGFSQGAMLATDVTLRLDEGPAALALFSGTLLMEEEWRKRAPRRRGLPVLQTHGRSDPILAFSLAERLRDLLTEAGLEVDFRPFHGPHTIPSEAVDAFADLVKARLVDR